MNNEIQSTIERIVMQRVHLIRALRFAVSGGVLSLLIAFLALWGIGREVWVAHILQNEPTNFLNWPQFYAAAFLHTRFIVQALIVLIVAALMFVAREISRALDFVAATKNS